ncbi:MAG TPA: YdcF family protein [Gemmatimonadaceae bacterium]|nr:YdcF family protein [Gemmatimonadaceae bacterium]
MRRLIRALGRLIAGFLLAIFGLWAASMAAVLIFSYIDQAKPAESIVVLGAAQYDGRPSPVLRARLDHGIDLWNRGMGKVLVLTGGKGAGDTTSEAEVGRAYARKHGIPDTVILLENKGRTTRESMLGVAQLLQDRGIKTAILVSDPFHMLRLSIIGRRFGLTPYTSPTQTSPISPNREKRWRYMLGESVKAPLAFLFERKQ